MIPAAMTDPTLAQRLLDGDRRALARAITLVEDDRPEGRELVKEVYPHTGMRLWSASPVRRVLASRR